MARTWQMRIRVEDTASRALGNLERALRNSDVVDDALFAGAQIIANQVRARAPQGETGILRGGVYAISAKRNAAPPQRTRRKGRRTQRVYRLRKRARAGQVYVVSAAFYGTFLERGRKARPGDPNAKQRRKRRGASAMTAKRWFSPAVTASRDTAARYVQQRLRAVAQATGLGV